MQSPFRLSFEKSIAVLPFVNLSADPENEYFSDGITEEIINALTKVQGLKVIARTSSFAFKNKSIDVRTIAQELGVATLLEGSVRKAQNRLRISAQLINAKDGVHIWSKRFDRELADIFALQDEISLLIADQLRENFGHLNIDEQLVAPHNLSVDLYQLYLKGKFFLNDFNSDAIHKGIEIMEQVVAQKPDFALAHVNIHYAYNKMAAGGLMPVEEALSIGKIHLDRGLELNDELPEAYHSLGWHSLNKDWNFKAATQYLKKAIELRPGYADAHQKLFINLALEGNLETAFEHISIALQHDPLSVLNNYFISYYYYLTDQFEKANESFERVFQLQPGFMVGYSIYALALTRQQRPDYILSKLKSIPQMNGAKVEQLIMQGLAYCQIPKHPQLLAVLEKLEEGLNGTYRERIRFFLIYIRTLMGDKKAALDILEEGIKNREPLITLIKVDPILRLLHKEERFQTALKKVYALSEIQEKEIKPKATEILSQSEVASILNALNQLMDAEDVYLDQEMSLRSLAERIDLHPNKLSWLINEHIGKNFNEYINSYRLTAFKEKALDAKNKHLTILGLAYESGFNSKTAFNSFFKKVEGVSPRTWLKANQL